jgi:hypothetical protein
MFVVQMPSFVIDGVADGQIAAAAECGSDKPQVTLKSKRTPQATERRGEKIFPSKRRGEKIFPSKKGLRDDSPPPRAWCLRQLRELQMMDDEIVGQSVHRARAAPTRARDLLEL